MADSAMSCVAYDAVSATVAIVVAVCGEAKAHNATQIPLHSLTEEHLLVKEERVTEM
jgi:hypothetical protein